MKKNIEFLLDFSLGRDGCPVCGQLPCVCGSFKSEANEKAGYPPNCNEGYVEKDGKCVPAKKEKKGYAEKHYPGKDVPRRKDGVPKKKQKKRATKPGEHRDKGGKLMDNKKKKKSKARYSELWKKVNADPKSK